MKIQLVVIEGPYKGKTFTFTEPDCFLVGRDASSSQAHFRLEGNKDMYVSRNHFFLEIKPPNCYIRDNDSKNGTHLKAKGDKDFKRITTAEVHDSDLIKIGVTVFKVSITEQEVEPVQAFHCIKCGNTIRESIENKNLSELRYEDFICKKCKKQKEKGVVSSPQKKFLCLNCGSDVSNQVNKDGRAEELHDIALYLCEGCASGEQEEVDIAKIKDYRILKELGRGGMGVVYKAWHEPTGRLVVLKKILPEVAMNERSNLLFQREMAVMKDLIHPNIVRLIDQGIYGKEPFFVSEYLPGKDADSLITEVYKGPVPLKEGCNIVCSALEGLDFAHNKGFVHRDIKPQNILLNKARTVAKISDYGLAKSYEAAGCSMMTKSGEVAGTILFMAPEQIVNYKYVKPSADVYSMGVTLYYLLTARYPFNFPSPLEGLMGLLKGEKPRNPILIVLEDSPIPIKKQNPNIPTELAQAVDKAIKKDVDKRFQSAREFNDAIKYKR